MITSMITRAQALRPLALAPRLAVYHPQLITSETPTPFFSSYLYVLYLTGANITFPRRTQRLSNPGDAACAQCLPHNPNSAAWSNPPLPSQLVNHCSCFVLPINLGPITPRIVCRTPGETHQIFRVCPLQSRQSKTGTPRMPCLCGCHFPLHRHFQQYMACHAPPQQKKFTVARRPT